MTHQFINNGTITSPRGFSAGAVFADIKAWQKKPYDLCLLYSDTLCTVTGVFTTNKVKAAPVILCQEKAANGRAQAIVANSGCANACTGDAGMVNAEQMAVLTARKLGISASDVLVASTGVIGTNLPMDRIEDGIDRIMMSSERGHDLAQAIMTTDTVPKEIAVEFEIEGKKITIGGVSKGAGMIHPNMATMLCFITSDISIGQELLHDCLQKAVDISFNMITVDGDTSTNDTVLILANGAAGNSTLHKDNPAISVFQNALDDLCIYLAKSIAKDGEGSTKLIEAIVEGALSDVEARMAARAIVSSPLVKTAVYGSDPNWGRIVAAAGRSGAELVASKVDLYLDGLCLLKTGNPISFDADMAHSLMEKEELYFRLCLNLGDGKATAWGCDFTEQYIALNGDYTT